MTRTSYTSTYTNLWDDVLYPSFYAAIRGTYYSHITRDNMDRECYAVARRAVEAFSLKWSKIDLSYETFYAVRLDDNTLEEVDENNPQAVPHAYFIEEVGNAEVEVILAWMKFYWAEMQVSNADNFVEMYADSNIKTYSKANAIDKFTKLMDTYRTYARSVEDRYSRINALRKPSIGDINTDE